MRDVSEALRASVVPRTLANRMSVARRYERYLQDRVGTDVDPYPSTGLSVAAFVQHEVKRRNSARSVSELTAGVRFGQMMKGKGVMTAEQRTVQRTVLRQATQGLERQYPGQPLVQSAEMRIKDVHKLVTMCTREANNTSTTAFARFSAAQRAALWTVAYWSALRGCEGRTAMRKNLRMMTEDEESDEVADEPRRHGRAYELDLFATKTDKGVARITARTCVVPKLHGRSYCPGSAVAAYVEQLDVLVGRLEGVEPDEVPLFPRLRAQELSRMTTAPTPWKMWTAAQFRKQLQIDAAGAGVMARVPTQAFGATSFRSGTATDIIASDVAEHEMTEEERAALLYTTGRWESSECRRYARASNESEARRLRNMVTVIDDNMGYRRKRAIRTARG